MNKIGRYDIISELGRGAMGVVYRASDPTIGREVALKVLTLSASPEEGTNSPQQMFMREVRAAGRLTHPSIVAIHDAFDDPENHTSCIVMEMVPGVTLEKILDSDPPPTTEEALDIVRQVAEGLDYAHRNQVIHRDLKPANILVTMDGRAKITDFGIAKVLAREGIARTVGVMGTPSYMSPEQVKGGEIDARTDIFSLGIMMFTMFTGKKPFAGNSAAVMFKIVYEEVPAPSSVNPRLTPGHDFVIKKCLAKDRNQRYASARELLGDLDDLQHGRFPRSQATAPAGAAAPTVPAARPPAVPAPSAAKPAPLPPAARPAPPPPPPSAAAPKPAPPPAPPRPPLSPPTPGGTLVMTRPSFLDEAPQPPPPRVAPPPPPVPPPPKPLSPPTPGGTMVMTRPSFLDGPPQPPPPRVAPPSPPTPKPYIPPPPPVAKPRTEQTLPMRMPDLSAAMPPTPQPPPAAPRPPLASDSTLGGQRPPLSGAPLPPMPPLPPRASGPPFPLPSPLLEPPPSQLSGVFSAVGPTPSTVPPPPSPGFAVEPEGAAVAVAPPSKSKLLPIALGGVAVVLIAAAGLVYWGIRRGKNAAPPPAQVAVQTAPVAPPPVTTPVETPTPPPATTAPQTPPATSAPATAVPAAPKKPVIRKPKPAATPAPPEPAPEPAPASPAPVATPAPSPPPPSPEDLAKAEAARLAKIPRIIQVLCNYGMKEATFVFSIAGKPLFEETLKGKKIKGGFLGIKGSYQGTFTHTITVPAGVQEVSVRVLAKDGATDLTKAIKMPPPGGFVPTLDVQVDSEHLALDWKGAAAAK